MRNAASLVHKLSPILVVARKWSLVCHHGHQIGALFHIEYILDKNVFFMQNRAKPAPYGLHQVVEKGTSEFFVRSMYV
jgi:hypothetical protein